MSIVTTWPVMAEFDEAVTEERLADWFRSVAALYLQSSPMLAGMIEAAAVVREQDIEVTMSSIECPHGALVSGGVSEVYPTAFLISYRARCRAGVHDVVATGQTRHVLISGDQELETPKELRDEFIARAHAARHYN